MFLSNLCLQITCLGGSLLCSFGISSVQQHPDHEQEPCHEDKYCINGIAFLPTRCCKLLSVIVFQAAKDFVTFNNRENSDWIERIHSEANSQL